MSRVLIVHRIAVQRHFLATFLEQEGYEVAQTATAEDACRLLIGQTAIHAMLVDLDVSDVSSREYCRVFRHAHDARFAGIPFLCLSSRLSKIEGERITAFLGGQAFIPLPVEPALLRQGLSQVLEEKTQHVPPQVLLVGNAVEWSAIQALIFREHGWVVEECQEACDVASRIAAHSPDLLVIHHPVLEHMNVQWVPELTRQAPFVRILVVTADQESQLALESLQYGAPEFVRGYLHQASLDGLFAKIDQDHVVRRLSWEGQDDSSVPGRSTEEIINFLRDFDEIIILTDDEGVIVDINAYGSRVLDWPVQEIRGHTLTMLEPSGPLNWLSTGEGMLPTREALFRTRSGSSLEVRVSGYPVHWNEGVRFILVAKYEQELTALRTEVRTLQGQVNQLTELEKVGQLAGGIAHDVNNILTAIQGHASLLIHHQTADPSIDHPLEVICQAVHRGQELTAQLLGAARRGKERRSSINVHDTIEEVLALLSGERTNGIQIIRECDARDSWIKGNARQLHQVLLNLIVNACDAMPHGGRVKISTASHVQGDLTNHQDFPLQGRSSLEIIVADSGCGIPDELRHAVFEPFFSTKPSSQGSGMGLAIVKEIVAAHGGRITMVSEVNQGTSFHLYFPQGQSVQSDLIHLPTALERPNPRVLVIDDEPLVGETTAEMLRFFECEPWVVHSGEEAIKQYRGYSDEIGVVVLDLSMPSISGEACFRALWAISPSVKIVFISGAEKNYFVQQLVDEGVAGFVQKPFDVEDLSQALKEVCVNDRKDASYALSGLSTTSSEGRNLTS